MNTKDLTTIVRDMRGLMPESSRTELAVRLVDLVGNAIVSGSNEAAFEDWLNAGVSRFLNDCQLTTSARPVVPYDMAVDESKIAAFCNRWLSVQAYRLADSDGELVPITPEMHGLRYSMIQELKVLAGLPVDELPESI